MFEQESWRTRPLIGGSRGVGDWAREAEAGGRRPNDVSGVPNPYCEPRQAVRLSLSNQPVGLENDQSKNQGVDLQRSNFERLFVQCLRKNFPFESTIRQET